MCLVLVLVCLTPFAHVEVCAASCFRAVGAISCLSQLLCARTHLADDGCWVIIAVVFCCPCLQRQQQHAQLASTLPPLQRYWQLLPASVSFNSTGYFAAGCKLVAAVLQQQQHAATFFECWLSSGWSRDTQSGACIDCVVGCSSVETNKPS